MRDVDAAADIPTDRTQGIAVAATLTLAAAAAALLFAAVPHGLYGDGYVRYQKIDTLLRYGTLGSERYSYIGPLAAAPLWLFGDSRMWWVARFNLLVLAAGAALAWTVLRPAMTRPERAAFVLLLLATGMMPNAARDFYGELFSAVTVGAGLMLVSVAGRRSGWIAVVAGVANMPPSGVGLLLVAVWRFWRTRRYDGAVALAAAAALVLIENAIVRGAPFDAGYAQDRGAITVLPFSGMPGFSYPFLLGVLSLLFSFGKGLLFFAPGLLLVAGVRRERPQLASFLELSIAFLCGLVIVYAQWWAWYGGWKWGPRFLLFAVYPSAIALAVTLNTAATWQRAAAAVALTCWTVWVGVSGAVFDLDGLDVCIANGYALEHLCWFVPDFSPLLRPLVIRPPGLALWQQAWMVLAALVVAALLTAGPSLGRIGDAITRALRR